MPKTGIGCPEAFVGKNGGLGSSFASGSTLRRIFRLISDTLVPVSYKKVTWVNIWSEVMVTTSLEETGYRVNAFIN